MRFYKHILLFLLVAYGCNDSRIYFQNTQQIDNQIWTYDQVVSFDLTVSDTLKYYHLDLAIDHAPTFEFQNLYLNFKSKFPDGSENEDLVSLELADKTGRWIGSCASKNCAAPFQLKTNMRFSQLGTHTFEIYQSTRIDSLGGIKAVSMQLLESERE